MYKNILVPIEVSPADAVILDHVRPLAKMLGSKLTLFHVATGWNARFFGQNADSDEIRDDSKYLEDIARQLREEGIEVETQLGTGEPVREIVKLASKIDCDLIAMTTHGHRAIGDFFLGSTVEPVRHLVEVPVLLLRVPKSPRVAGPHAAPELR